MASAKKEITLDMFYENWLFEKRAVDSESTIYRHDSLYRHHISPILGSMPIYGISRQDIISLQARLYPELKSTTTNMIIFLLSGILKAALQDELIDRNPCSTVSSVRAKEGEISARDTIHRALTKEETAIFLEYTKDYWYYHLFLFLFNTGCRCGEASALRWSDIDLENENISINRTVKRCSAGLIEGKPKTVKSKRQIPINDVVMQVLEFQKEHRPEDDDHIFFSTNGKRFSANLINSDLKSLLDGLERHRGFHIDWFSVHAMRDTFATRALEAGMSPNTLKEILGHGSLAMTMDLYAHVMSGTKREEMKKVRILPTDEI